MTHQPRCRRWQVMALGVLLWALASGVSRAQSVRVIVDGSNVWTNSAVMVIVTVVRAGTILEVRGRQGDWYIVEVPNNPSQLGRILARQVEPVSVAPGSSPTSPRTPEAPRPPPSQPANPRGSPKPFLSVNAAYQPMALRFENAESFTLLLEKGTRNTDYQVTRGPGFDVGAGGAVARRLTMTGVFSWRTRTDQASVDEQLPHPIHYNQPRSLTAQANGKRQETAAHVQLGWMAALTPRIQLMIGGGPSLFYVKQAVVSDVAYTETYPYDVVAYESVLSETVSKVGIGVNAQVDVIVPVSPRVGWQTTARFSRASLEFRTANGTFRVPAGGVQIGAGFRVHF